MLMEAKFSFSDGMGKRLLEEGSAPEQEVMNNMIDISTARENSTFFGEIIRMGCPFGKRCRIMSLFYHTTCTEIKHLQRIFCNCHELTVPCFRLYPIYSVSA